MQFSELLGIYIPCGFYEFSPVLKRILLVLLHVSKEYNIKTIHIQNEIYQILRQKLVFSYLTNVLIKEQFVKIPFLIHFIGYLCHSL